MSKTIVKSHHAPAPIGPYSQAVLAAGVLYTSGQIAIDPQTGHLVTGDIISETHQVLKNLQYVLNAADMDFENVVKCTIFIRNMDDFQTINGIYGQYFEKNHPARETVEVSRLPKDVNIEISCVAAR
jgi:2-iminobutanoate/2-iminopropanoate deaminase